MNDKVDLYLLEGCGRCPKYQTPECKVHSWQEELHQLRRIVLECGLKEEFKWSQPCYTFDSNNVLIVTAFKDYAALAFFKGALLKDPDKILIAPGKDSQSARQVRFSDVNTIIEMESILKKYILESIEIEKAGLKVDFKAKTELVFPEELLGKFEEYPALENAFKTLTPGRQRGYILYFTQPKQSKTRESRIEKCKQQIFEGKGWNGR